MKILAMYLPQYHEVKENNEWWGEGFTDWVSTKAAKPLFSGHYQPHIPYNNNYYDLNQKESMLWQANIMHQYGIDGMCMYHYWFKDGRRILEKPVENLLNWKDVNMPFCLYWANETWARSWGNVQNSNSWAATSEGEVSGKKILLEQKYGEEEQWKNHFDYLLPFFKDERYIKINNKPVFLIYKCYLIDCIHEMMDCWNELAKQNGFEGIYFIGSNMRNNKVSLLNAQILHSPGYIMERLDKGNRDEVYHIDYDCIWEEILSSKSDGVKTYYTGVVGYDDTPRRGKKGVVLEGSTPEKFKNYMAHLLAKSAIDDNEFVFVNAWNEWAEGMHLEPDVKYMYEYLSAIKEAKRVYMDYIGEENQRNLVQPIEKKASKFEDYLNKLDDWMTLREDGVSLVEYLVRNNIKNIALYGFGIFGRHMVKELENSSVDINYIIDQDTNKKDCIYQIVTLTDKLPNVDAVIVCAPFYYDDIYKKLKEKNFKRIISIYHLITEARKLE